MAILGSAVRWATNKVDEKVVSPVTNRLVTSVANPYVMSYLIWDRIKKMTPQRARDMTRLISTAIANAVSVLGAEKGKALTGKTKKLQDEFVTAAVSRKGRDVLLNTVATASKVAQALNTPETKVATTQVFETLQCLIDFFASEEGRKVIATAGECLNQFCEVVASPESSIFLAEIATNICHAMDVEAQRKDAERKDAERDDGMSDNQRASDLHEMMGLEDKTPSPPSPTSSAADTGFETESNASEAAGPYVQRRQPHLPAASPVCKILKKKHFERSASRSARIEKDVLLKMGVDPTMIGEIQRILDTIAAEEETELMKLKEAAGIVGSDNDDDYTDDEDAAGDDSAISHAFGLRSTSPLPEVEDEEQKVEDEETERLRDPATVVLPEWHQGPVRQALRRRHAQVEESVSQRHTYETQAREMAAVLAQRKVGHGVLDPADVLACRVISLIITYGIGFILIMMVYNVVHKLVFM